MQELIPKALLILTNRYLMFNIDTPVHFVVFFFFRFQFFFHFHMLYVIDCSCNRSKTNTFPQKLLHIERYCQPREARNPTVDSHEYKCIQPGYSASFL